HPRHLKTSIPYSLALRCRRICSDTNEAKLEINNLMSKFSTRGHPKKILDDANKRAFTRTTSLKKQTLKEEPINLIVTFNKHLPKFNNILRNHFSILRNDPETKNIFTTAPRVVFRRPKNLKDYLVRARLHKPVCTEKTIEGCRPCKKPRCVTCSQMLTATQVESTSSNFTFYIKGSYDCQTQNAVYLLQCTACNLQYIGQTSTPFHIRMNNHRSHCNTQLHLGISKHVHEKNHMFSNFKCAILKSNFRNTHERECFESYLIQLFNTREG